MGGSSRSSQSSLNTSTTNTTTSTRTSTTNQSLNAAITGDVEEGAIALSGKNVSITQVDPKALDFAGKTIEGVGGVITSLLENQKETYAAANSLAGTAIANLAAASGVEPIEIGKKPLTQVQKIGLGVGGFVSLSALAYALMRKKK
jgi:hypothetical protein